MNEARRLKNGRWRLYKTPDLYPVRDPATGAIPTFESLSAASRWWLQRHPDEPPPHEAVSCAKCGAYFGRGSNRTLDGGLYYHLAHRPQVIAAERGPSTPDNPDLAETVPRRQRRQTGRTGQRS